MRESKEQNQFFFRERERERDVDVWHARERGICQKGRAFDWKKSTRGKLVRLKDFTDLFDFF